MNDAYEVSIPVCDILHIMFNFRNQVGMRLKSLKEVSFLHLPCTQKLTLTIYGALKMNVLLQI